MSCQRASARTLTDQAFRIDDAYAPPRPQARAESQQRDRRIGAEVEGAKARLLPLLKAGLRWTPDR